MSDIFREVGEDVRSARLRAMWDSYGLLVIGAVVALVLGAAFTVYWQDVQKSQREASAEQFLAGEKLLLEGKYAEAEAQFAKLSAEAGGRGYTFLASMKEAAAKLGAGDISGAAAVYDAIAADGRYDALQRDLAALKAAMLLADSASPDELRLRLAPLARPDNPWRHTAGELLAFLALRLGETDQARTGFQTLADDLSAPNGVRARAAEILSTFPPASAAPIAQPAASTGKSPKETTNTSPAAN